MQPYLVFDVEVKRTTDEVAKELKLMDGLSAFNYPHKLGFSVGVVYNSVTDEFLAFQTAKDFADYLLKYNFLLVSFNGIRFDLPVLLDEIDIDSYRELENRPHLDILQDFYIRVNKKFRVGLDNLSMNTLGKGKIGNGADAPLLYQEGKFDALIEYCRNDVLLTKEIFEFGYEQGYIQYYDNFKGGVCRLEVKWDFDA